MARKLRRHDLRESVLWNELKGDRPLGFDFDRQRCIDNDIVDIYCKDLMLAIEIDGMSHNHEDAFLKDNIRQQKLESSDITFLRLSEAEVKYDIVNVLRSMETGILDLKKINQEVKLPKGFNSDLLNS